MGVQRGSSESHLRSTGSLIASGPQALDTSGSFGSLSSTSDLERAAARCKAKLKNLTRQRGGKMDLVEVTKFLRKRNPGMTELDCKHLFGQVDKSGSGLVDAEELVDCIFAEGEARPASSQERFSKSPTAQSSLKAFRQHPRNSASKAADRLVLSADCGGTTTRLMLFRVCPDDAIEPKSLAPGELVKEIKYPNIMFRSFKDIVQTFLKQDCGLDNPKPTVAVFAVAGIVIDNSCRFTNLDWVVSGEELERELDIGRVELINDFVAQGYGMLTLADEEVTPLNDATPRPGAPKSCIGAGTGLGQCFLVPDGPGEYRCFPSEGQHGEFGPRGAGSDDLQIELLKYLKIKFSGWTRISVERVVSGTGICNVYEFMAFKFPEQVDPLVHREHIMKPKDASVIVQNAKPGTLCERALKIFASAYGAQVGTMALFLQPFGGLYVTGGVTKKIRDWLLQEGSFLSTYYDKGRLTPICEQVPLLLVNSDDMGQRGAHYRAVKLLKIHVRTQAERLYMELVPDCNSELSRPRLEAAIRERPGSARQLLVQLRNSLFDDSAGGAVDFDSFCNGVNALPAEVVAGVHVYWEEEGNKRQSKDTLVAPPNRGNDPESRRELATLLSKYDKLRAEYQNQPIFKAKIWQLVGKDRGSASDWQEREYWINNHGALLYFSKEEEMTRLYGTQHDLEHAIIEETSDPASAMPWTFRIMPRGDAETNVTTAELAASSEAGRAYWLQQLRELQQPGARPGLA